MPDCHVFESLSDFTSATNKAVSRINHRRSNVGDWYGGSWSSALQNAIKGDDSLVPQALSLLNQLEDCQLDDLRANRWVPAPYGAFPVVPDYLSGSPCPMRARRRVVAEIAPVTLYADLGSSSGLSVEDLMIRGTAILALVLRLQQVRPVNLAVVSINQKEYRSLGNIGVVIHLNTQPLDLATACYVLTSSAFYRRLILAYQSQRSTDHSQPVTWSQSFVELDGEHHSAAYCNWVRNFVNASPEDLYIPHAFLGDPLIANPVAWINRTINEMEHPTCI